MRPERCMGIGLVLVLMGCKEQRPATTPEMVVASAYGTNLTASELMEGLPRGLSPKDSLIKADRAINDWLQRQSLVHLAESELPEEERNVSRAVARYRESLLIHAYEDRYLRDHLDTALTAEELQAFLNEQADLFRIDAPLFQARWVVFPEGRPFPRDIRDLTKQLASEDPEKLSILASRCSDAGMPFDLDADRWLTWEEIGQTVPLDPNRTARLQSSRRVSRIDWKTTDTSGTTAQHKALLLIKKQLPVGSLSPLERVSERIGELLLHRRRNRTLEAMRQQAVQSAWAEAALTTSTGTGTTPSEGTHSNLP